jgi:hypothetical protein
MADGGANHPAARALRSPATSRESSFSGARLATPKPYVVPPSLGRPSQSAPASLPATTPVLAESPLPLAAAPSNDAPPLAMKESSVPSLAQLRRESSAAEVTQPPVASAWGEFATAPTLLLTPPDDAETDEAASTTRMYSPSASDDAASTSRIATSTSDDAASTSRIVGPSTPPLEHQPWYRTGLTVPPPSMRPAAESAAPVRNAPSPRVLKIVAGVIGGCLFIVAIAGVKVLYRAATAPAVAPIGTRAMLTPPADPRVAVAAPPNPAAAAAPSEIREAPPATAAAPTASTPAAEVRRSTPPRTTAPRTPVKTAPRRAPVSKKVVKSTH